MHPVNMAPKQSKDDMVLKFARYPVFMKEAITDEFTEERRLLNFHAFRHYRVQNPRAGVTDITFQSEALLPIQKDAGITSTTSRYTYN